ALRPSGAPEPAQGEWLAVADGRVVGAGASPGRARRDARLRGCDSVPVVRRA
ncbi:hypothetical protein GTX23_35120, partial [Streptomyces sp. SID6139]|nr:hypothetical protein [Streptomyces sp. SID6139]